MLHMKTIDLACVVLDWSKERLAQECGISASHLSNVKAGRYPLTKPVEQKIMYALINGGITMDELLTLSTVATAQHVEPKKTRREGKRKWE